jgi:hypothetical protein
MHKNFGKGKTNITVIEQFLVIPRSNPRALGMEFWGNEVQPIALIPTNLPASTIEFKLKQHSQPGLYIFVMQVTDRFKLDIKGEPVWYTDGSKNNTGTGVGAYNGVKKGAQFHNWAPHHNIPGCKICH